MANLIHWLSSICVVMVIPLPNVRGLATAADAQADAALQEEGTPAVAPWTKAICTQDDHCSMLIG